MMAVRGVVAAIVVIAAAGVLTGCGTTVSAASSGGGTASDGIALSGTASLVTTLSTATASWAVVPVSASPAFWEVLVRPAASATWRLVTPPGVASNGGLVAAAGRTGALTVAVRPSQGLLFTPLTATTDAGATWASGTPLNSAVAAAPDALAAAGDDLAAVLGDGTLETSANAGASWRALATPAAIAASPGGTGCQTVAVSGVSFGITGGRLLAAGRCGTGGTTAIFAQDGPGGWQRVSLPVAGPLVRLFPGGAALVRAGAGLTMLWPGDWLTATPAPPAPPAGQAWQRSAALPVTGPVVASGALAGTASGGTGAWVLLAGGRAATINGPGQPWLLLPPLPAATRALASGPGSATDALAVSGASVTVWRLPRAATVWTKIQTITVPVQPGSSS
jgi:hypothetical protein